MTGNQATTTKSPQRAKGTRGKPSTPSKSRKENPPMSVGGSNRDKDQPAEQSAFTPEQWQEMVATAAYYRAERRGFERGSPVDDWLEAEAELRRAHGVE
ncbi:MAG TPA: DUF2934 domain-containing protein [Burkholderiales bacterium]|nr:DUF2934 domain-containing protein [Burkholderiales bacterium]